MNQCINLPTKELQKIANEAKIVYVTLDSQADRVKVCKQLSMHQKPLVLKDNKVNSDLTNMLKTQLSKNNSTCNSACKPY